MRILVFSSLIAASLGLSALAYAANDYTIIKYKDGKIKYSEVQDTWKTLFPGGSAPDFKTFDENIRQNVLRGLVRRAMSFRASSSAPT